MTWKNICPLKDSQIGASYRINDNIATSSTQINLTYIACPYGKLNIWDIVGILNDYNNSYKWRYYNFKSQIVPGKNACNDSNWRNSDVKQTLDADFYSTQGFLSDYKPTTTIGTSTITVGLSVSVQGDRDGISPGVSLYVEWSYSTPDVIVLDQSDFSQMKAAWWHDIDETKFVGSYTYLSEPGAIFRFPEQGTFSWYTKTTGRWAQEVCSFIIFCNWEYSAYYGYVVKWVTAS